MNTALKVGPFILIVATMMISWLFGNSNLTMSAANGAEPAAVSLLSTRAADDLALKTRGAWVCQSMDCSFRRWASGDSFRSAAHQDCPFCGRPLQRAE